MIKKKALITNKRSRSRGVGMQPVRGLLDCPARAAFESTRQTTSLRTSVDAACDAVRIGVCTGEWCQPKSARRSFHGVPSTASTMRQERVNTSLIEGGYMTTVSLIFELIALLSLTINTVTSRPSESAVKVE